VESGKMTEIGASIQASLGVRTSKRNTSDRLVLIMREVVKENPTLSKFDIGSQFLKRCKNHSDFEDELYPRMMRMVADLIYDRVVVHKNTEISDEEDEDEKVVKAKKLIMQRIIWWDWRVPTANKPLRNCTFGECREAAQILGKGMSQLSVRGEIDQQVKEVFSKETLQEFFETIIV
jgi:hypothetical protein